MVSMELESTNVDHTDKSNANSVADQVYDQIDDTDIVSHRKEDFNKCPLHPFSSSPSLFYSNTHGNASIADISISGTDCDVRSNGYDSDSLLNSGYAASISEATRSVASMGGFNESENGDTSTAYMTAAEQLSVRPSSRRNRSVSPLEISQEEKSDHSSIQQWREKRRKNRTPNRRDPRMGTIASDFRDFLGWDSTGDEQNNMTQFQSNDVESRKLKNMGKFKSFDMTSIFSQHNVSDDEPVKVVLERWSKSSIPCVVMGNVHSQDAEEDVSTINDSCRFDTENFPVIDDKTRDDVDLQIDSPSYYQRTGGILGWLFMSIIAISILTLIALIVVALTQRI